jgi:hypothetical protein
MGLKDLMCSRRKRCRAGEIRPTEVPFPTNGGDEAARLIGVTSVAGPDPMFMQDAAGGHGFAKPQVVVPQVRQLFTRNDATFSASSSPRSGPRVRPPLSVRD